ARPEPVAASDAGGRVDRVAQRPQPRDVAADRPRLNAEPVGQLAARPGGPGLEQGEEVEQPGRRFHAERLWSLRGGCAGSGGWWLGPVERDLDVLEGDEPVTHHLVDPGQE